MFLVFPFRNTYSSELAGKIVSVTGKVYNSKSVLLSSGSEIRVGDLIRTTEGATARFLMTDQTVIDVDSSSVFKVDEYKLNHVSDRHVTIALDSGKVRASVTEKVKNSGRFNFRTKSATMGVRGTEFVVAEDHGKTEVTVVHGEVVVLTAGSAPISLGGGKQLTTTSSRQQGGATTAATSKPEIKSLSSNEMGKVVQESKVDDHTFSQAVTVESSTSASSSGGAGSSSTSGLASAIAIQQSAPPSVVASAASVPLSVPGGQTNQIISTPVITLLPGSTVTAKVVFVK